MKLYIEFKWKIITEGIVLSKFEEKILGFFQTKATLTLKASALEMFVDWWMSVRHVGGNHKFC